MLSIRPTRLTLAIAMALAAPMPQTSLAQASDSDEAAIRLDEVQVTSRRRDESLQDVPVAVTAFSEEDLRELQARNLEGLQGAVPNINIVQGRGSASSVNVFIRGVGQPDALQTFDPGVGVYVDDVYYSRIQGALLSLFDIEQIEVLRGPQGTLYGKNSTGGAIKINTRTPGPERRFDAEFSTGDFGRLEAKMYAAGEIGNGIYASLAALTTSTDGYIRDPASGRKFNDDDTQAFRIKLFSQPTEALSWTLSADYTRQDNQLAMGNPEADLRQTDLALGAVVLRPRDPSPYDYRSRTSFAPDQGQELDHWGLSFHLEYLLSDTWALKSISSHRKLITDFFIDIDGSEFELGDVLVALDQKQSSQEFQLQYSNNADLNAVFGLYWLRETVPSHQEAYADDLLAFNGAPIDFLRTIDDDLATKSYAAFAHASWDFHIDWSLGVGLRYSRDEKDYFRTTSTFSGLPALNGSFAFNADKSWDAWTPSISLQRRFSADHMAYISAARGFKSGGFNGRANGPNDVSAFDPEYVSTVELGWKGRSADGRMRLNAALFHTDYSDFQARVAEDLASFPVLNAAELKIDGAELEFVALVGSSTSLSGQLGWLDARYDKFLDARFANADRSSDKVPFSPEWTFRLGVNHSIPLASGAEIQLGADARYRSKTWLSVDNRDVLTQDSFWLTGAYASYEGVSRNWSISAGVRNLGDKLYKTDAQEFASVGNIQTAYYGWPRHFYLSLRYSF